jgi:hypothetical protein
MPKHFRKRKKPFKRRLYAWLGIHHTSRKYYLIYFLALIALIFLFPVIMKVFTDFKKYYGQGYGYVPRDFERSEKLRAAKKPIPFQPKGAWQYGERDEEKKERLEPYH